MSEKSNGPNRREFLETAAAIGAVGAVGALVAGCSDGMGEQYANYPWPPLLDQAGRLEQGQDQLVGGSRIGGALENHQLVVMQALADLLDRGDDVGDIGVSCLAQRRRHTDVDRIDLGQAVEVSGGGEPAPGRLEARL